MVKEDLRDLRLLGGGGVVVWRVMEVSWSEGRAFWGGLTRPGMLRFVGWVIVNEGDWGVRSGGRECTDHKATLLTRRGKHDGRKQERNTFDFRMRDVE